MFRMGSIYIPSIEEKHNWESFENIQRVQILFSGKYPWLSFEIGLFSIMIVYFAFLRFGTPILLTFRKSVVPDDKDNDLILLPESLY